MPRPRKRRHVEFVPDIRYFKPACVPMRDLTEVQLGVDELEALRLKDLEGLDQDECAEHMNLAQSTFQRLLTGARTKVTRAIVEGSAIRIEGGHIKVVQRTFQCPECGYRWERGDEEEEEAPASCPACGSSEVGPRWRRHGCGWGGHGRRG